MLLLPLNYRFRLETRPGDKANITYIRNGKQSTIPIVMKNVAGNTAVVTRDMGSGIVYGAKLEALITDKRTFKIDYGVKVTELNDGRSGTWNQKDTLYSA